VGNADPKSAAAQGVGCSFCHQAVGTTAPARNVSLLIEPSGVYRAQISTPQAPHPVGYSPFHATSEICGSCHNVSHPGNGLPLETTYSEWQASPQAKAGVQCQGCHMTKAPGAIGPSMGWAAGGAPLRPIYQMTFTGAQVGLGNATFAQQMLKSAAVIKIDAPPILDQSKTASATITVTNVGAGHSLPTGLTEIREMWLSVTMTGPDGKEIELGRHQYGTVLKDAAGKYPADLWTATGIQSDDRIPPMGSSVSAFKIAFPSGVQYGTLKAKLLYRSVPEVLAKKAAAPNPTTVMVEEEQMVFANLAGRQQYNKTILAEAATSPLMPLVMAVFGILLCVGIVIFFVVWGRRSSKPRPPKPTKSSSGDADTEAEDGPSNAEDDTSDTDEQTTDGAEQSAASSWSQAGPIGGDDASGATKADGGEADAR